MWASDALYSAYSRQVRRGLDPDQIPRHVGVILDGNRRWATLQGSSSEAGHRAGAAKIKELLGWCESVGVEVVTLWLLSTDNLSRPGEELTQLFDIITDTVDALADEQRWRLNPVGALAMLPPQVSGSLKESAERTEGVEGLLVNVAVGYGGRREVVDAVRSLLQAEHERGSTLDDVAALLDVEHIADHLYMSGQPDPDLVIRTSGEQRLSGFLMWQSAHSEFHFCEALWPDFREVDFLRAIRSYGQRHRRFGT